MDDDKTNEPNVTPTPPPGKPRKRAPATIDLKAASVSDTPVKDEATERASTPDEQAASSSERTESPSSGSTESSKPSRSVAPILIAAASGAVASCVVLGVAWFAMSPGGKSDRARAAQSQASVKTDLDTLNSRIAKIETRPAASATPSDAASTARLDALEKSIASLRDDVASTRSAIDAMKSAPRETTAPDLSAVEERMNKIERATVALTGEVAAPKPVEQPKPPEEDSRLRMVAVAASLDTSVRQSEPYAATLAAARSLAGDVSVLKPLDAFADKGIPSVSALNKELLALLPQLAPKMPAAAAPAGLMDRLQQSAARLVRVERVDPIANDKAAAVARIKAAAERGDIVAARREVDGLVAADRAALQSWSDKVDARDAALSASKQFASDMTTALAKPSR